jgi:hypothetical protein
MRSLQPRALLCQSSLAVSGICPPPKPGLLPQFPPPRTVHLGPDCRGNSESWLELQGMSGSADLVAAKGLIQVICGDLHPDRQIAAGSSGSDGNSRMTDCAPEAAKGPVQAGAVMPVELCR